MADRKIEAANRIAEILNAGEPPAYKQWKELTTIVNEFKTIQQKNAVIDRVLPKLADYIGYVTFTAPNKLIVGDQTCCGKRTVFIIKHKVYDILGDIVNVTIGAYFKILSAYNTLIKVDMHKTTYLAMNKGTYTFNRKQWELLTTYNNYARPKDVIDANPLWASSTIAAMCSLCGTEIIFQSWPKHKVICPSCGSNKIIKI